MIVNLDIDLDHFKELILAMPASWLLNYYNMLHTDNEEYHKLIDIVLDVNGTLDVEDSVIEKQIKCFNMLIAVSNILIHRGIPTPIYGNHDAF